MFQSCTFIESIEGEFFNKGYSVNQYQKKIWGQTVTELVEKGGHSVALSCRLFGRCRQAWYQSKSDIAAEVERDSRLLANVREIREEDPRIEGLSEKFNKEYWNYAKLISGVLRWRMPIDRVIKLVAPLQLDSENINTWKNGVERALKKYVIDGTKRRPEVPELRPGNLGLSGRLLDLQELRYLPLRIT